MIRKIIDFITMKILTVRVYAGFVAVILLVWLIGFARRSGIFVSEDAFVAWLYKWQTLGAGMIALVAATPLILQIRDLGRQAHVTAIPIYQSIVKELEDEKGVFEALLRHADAIAANISEIDKKTPVTHYVASGVFQNLKSPLDGFYFRLEKIMDSWPDDEKGNTPRQEIFLKVIAVRHTLSQFQYSGVYVYDFEGGARLAKDNTEMLELVEKLDDETQALLSAVRSYALGELPLAIIKTQIQVRRSQKLATRT